MRRLALVPTLAAVLLFPSVAAALGLGDIEVRSALNQRLDAEIPLRGVAEGRADDIVVTLASEKAFEDVGLRRPHALRNLEFTIRQGGDGRHYVHATSTEPIAEPFLSFLLEVDGPGGNLLREYTVLLDPPVFATERAQEAEETAPEAAPEAEAVDDGDIAAADMSGEIERDDGGAQRDTGAGAETEPPGQEAIDEPEALAAAPEDRAGERSEFGDTPVFLQVEREQERAERDERERAARREEPEQEEALAEPYQPGAAGADEPSAGAAGARGGEGGLPTEHGPVERGDTLWGIASRLRRGDMTVQQVMLALLRYNPDAFVDGNINRLKQGYVLRVPDEAEMRSVPTQQAIARVREQNSLWREWRAAVRGEDQDTAVAERRADDTDADAAETEAEAADADAAAAAEGDESRLSIVGSREDGASSSDESASATTEGGAATEELALAREQLESARMEKAELESRVEDLEGTVDKMERLITLREDQLARLQEQLQELQQDQAERAEQAEQAEQAAAVEEQAPEGDTGEPEDAAAPADGADEPADDGGAAATGAADGDGTGGGGSDDASRSSDTGAAESDTTTATTEDGGAAAPSAETTPAGDGAEAAGTRADASAGGWLDRITGTAAGIAAAFTGVLGGLVGGAGAGPMSPGVLAAAALLVLALGGLLLVRRRQAARIEAMEDTAPADTDEVDLGRMEAGSDVIAEELDTTEAARSSAAPAEASSPLEEALDLGALETGTDEQAASVASPEEDAATSDDTVAEAEVYLAYGLHQQAEDLLRLALRESPERADYHEKLLETLYGAAKKGEFVTEATTFHDMVESTDSRMWQRVVAMGREIAPEHDLFRKSAAPDVRPEELQKSRPATADIELDAGEGDLGAFEGEADAHGPGEEGGATTPEAAAGEDLDFDLGDFGPLAGADEATEAAGDARAAEASAGTGADADDALDFDLGDFGQLAGADEATEAAGDARAAEASAGTGADADDALDFDLGDLGDFGQLAGADEATEVAGDAHVAEAGAEADDAPDLDLGDFEQLAAGDEATEAGGGERVAEASADADDALEFDLGDLGGGGEVADDDEGGLDFDIGLDDSIGGVDETPAGASAGEGAGDTATAEVPDLDLDGLEAEPSAGSGGDSDDSGEYELDIGEPSAAGPGADSGLAAAIGDIGDEEDEFDTMLDLARAYIDMGDPESASNALEEVIESGSEKQRNEARSLLETVH